MRTKMIKRFLSGINEAYTDSETEWIPATHISEISMNSDGNQVLGKFQDYVKFDFTNELVKVKKYRPELISGIFRDYKMGLLASNKVSIKRFGESFYFPTTIDLNIFREVRVGDTVYLLNKKSGKRETKTYLVTAIEKKADELIIEINGNISSITDMVLGYAETDKLANSSIFPEDEALSIVYHPITEHAVDIYLDFAEVSAIIGR